ncbi:hypothetical protein ABBQ32_006782 [Trebouxia sp. C0010 RCD-2024]
MQLAREQFRAEGYAVLPNFLKGVELNMLRQECDVIVEHAFEQLVQHGKLDNNWEATQKGCVFETLNTKPSKLEATDQQAYAAIRSQWPCDPAVCRLLFGPKMTRLVTSLLRIGSGGLQHHVSLFNDQYIVKPPRCPQSGFAWHRDSDWCTPDLVCKHTGYLSLWCALDDMTADNGCLHIWSGGADQNPDVKPSTSEGHSVPVQAGTAVVMGDRLMHCSLPNSSNHARRAWMPQFSQQPILLQDTDCPVTLAVPLF